MAADKKMTKVDDVLRCLGTWYVKSGSGMMVDVFYDKSRDTLEAWLYDNNYGMKTLMFGLKASKYSLDRFIEIVENNVDDCADIYWKEIEKIEE